MAPIICTAPPFKKTQGGEEGEGSRRGGGWTGAGRALLEEMHPTPAVCGKPRDVTYPVIGEVEGFDRYSKYFLPGVPAVILLPLSHQHLRYTIYVMCRMGMTRTDVWSATLWCGCTQA